MPNPNVSPFKRMGSLADIPENVSEQSVDLDKEDAEEEKKQEPDLFDITEQIKKLADLKNKINKLNLDSKTRKAKE